MAETVRVQLWSGLRRHADGQDAVEVEAATTGEMLAALADACPGLKPVIDAGVSVAIDGRIYPTSLTEPVRPGQEIVLMQRLKGG